MDKRNKKLLHKKVIKMIDSCTNNKQLFTTLKFATLAANVIGEGNPLKIESKLVLYQDLIFHKLYVDEN